MTRPRQKLLTFMIGFFVFGASVCSTAQRKDYFSNWPAGTSPQEVGKRVAEHFVTSPHQDPQRIIYPEVCAWYGSLTFAQLSDDKDLTSRLIKRFDPLLSPPGSDLVSKERHVDFSMFGSLPLEIYIETKDPKYLEMGCLLYTSPSPRDTERSRMPSSA